MNFTDFLYDVFTLKSYETKSYVETEKGGEEREREWVSELVESLNETQVSQRRHHKMEYYQEPDPETVRVHLQRLAWAWKRTSEQDRHCPL